MSDSKITWIASNNSTYMTRERSANTLLSAARAARKFLRTELMGEGQITYFEDGVEVRVDEVSMFTGYKMLVRTLANG